MNKTGVKIIAIVIVAVMVLGLFSGVLAMFAYGAETGAAGEKPQPVMVDSGKIVPSNLQNTNSNGKIAADDSRFNITFTFSFSGPEVERNSYHIESNSFLAGRSDISVSGPNNGEYTVTISNIEYNGGNGMSLNLKFNARNLEGSVWGEWYVASLYVPIDGSFFEPSLSSGTGSGDDDDADVYSDIVIYTADTTVSQNLTVGEETRGLTISFYYDNASLWSRYDSDQFSIPANSSFSWGNSSRLTVTSSGNRNRARLSGITYNGGSDRILKLTLASGEVFEVPIPNKYFDTDSSDGDTPPASDIVVESVIAKNAAGQRLVEITEDTPPFTVEIMYYDIGLMNETSNYLERAKLHAFVTNATGFKTPGGNRGKLELLSTNSQYPRFKVTFENIQCDGTANSLGFRVQYDLSNYDDSVKGEGTAIMYQVEKTEEEDELAPLKPNVIVEAYSYGEEPIVAGDEFDLDITFKNTSKSVGVENVVMTIEPASGFAIAAASNTDFFQTMSPGESIPYSVALKANPAGDSAGAQTDYSIVVKFAYQYLSKKEYAVGETSVKIAIPIVQLDRFLVDEITDYSQMLQVGEEGYVSVPITNKGKSPTYNITGSVKVPEGIEVTAPSVHFGNLEAGKSGTVDISVTFNTPGQFDCEAVILYEDENMKQKELSVPFSIMVNQMETNMPEMMPDMNQEETAAKMPPLAMAFCGAGGLMMAAPIALYAIKRVRAKGSGDADEDF